jgi:hypothetical protein
MRSADPTPTLRTLIGAPPPVNQTLVARGGRDADRPAAAPQYVAPKTVLPRKSRSSVPRNAALNQSGPRRVGAAP